MVLGLTSVNYDKIGKYACIQFNAFLSRSEPMLLSDFEILNVSLRSSRKPSEITCSVGYRVCLIG